MKVSIKVQKDGYIVLGTPVSPKQSCIIDSIVFPSIENYLIGTVLTIDLATRKIEKAGIDRR